MLTTVTNRGIPRELLALTPFAGVVVTVSTVDLEDAHNPCIIRLDDVPMIYPILRFESSLGFRSGARRLRVGRVGGRFY